MVAVMTELMVGGERSAQDDSIKGSARTLVSKLRLRALLQATARTHLSLTTSSPLLTDTFAQTKPSSSLSLAIKRRTIHSGLAVIQASRTEELVALSLSRLEWREGALC